MAIRKRLAFLIERDQHLTIASLAQMLDLSKYQVARHIRNSPALSAMYVPKNTNGTIDTEVKDAMRDFIEDRPDAKLIDIASAFSISIPGVCQFMRRNKLNQFYTKKGGPGFKKEVNRDLLRTLLIEVEGNRSEIARRLKVHGKTVTRWIKELDLQEYDPKSKEVV